MNYKKLITTLIVTALSAVSNVSVFAQDVELEKEELFFIAEIRNGSLQFARMDSHKQCMAFKTNLFELGVLREAHCVDGLAMVNFMYEVEEAGLYLKDLGPVECEHARLIPCD